MIVGTIVASLSVSLTYAQKGMLDEELLNISGRQGMLSQRIVLAAFRYNETKNPRYRRIILDSLGDFTKSHHWILDNLEAGTAAWDHYHDENGAQLDGRSIEFIHTVWGIAHAQSRSTAPPDLLQRAEEEALTGLLEPLNQAVLLFEEEANARSAFQKTLLKGTLLFVLLLVGVKAVFVFLPAHRQLSGLITRLRISDIIATSYQFLAVHLIYSCEVKC
jgi:hypothetical protein